MTSLSPFIPHLPKNRKCQFYHCNYRLWSFFLMDFILLCLVFEEKSFLYWELNLRLFASHGRILIMILFIHSTIQAKIFPIHSIICYKLIIWFERPEWCNSIIVCLHGDIRGGTQRKPELFFKGYLFSIFLQNNLHHDSSSTCPVPSSQKSSSHLVIPFKILSIITNKFVLLVLPLFETFYVVIFKNGWQLLPLFSWPLQCCQIGVLSCLFSCVEIRKSRMEPGLASKVHGGAEPCHF